ncbi:MAG: acriflavin resistance protein [Anaerolineae bacterium]|nr:MAG: acriflavin resistance protein [Anaerolineae bacterium]
MVRWIVESSLKLRFLVVILAVVLLTMGIMQLRDAPVDVFPEFNPPMVEVQTEALGLSAAEIESLLTVPMEADLLNGVAWLDQIYSESVAGLSSILLIFEPGTDPIRARQMVQERLTQTFALPNVSLPPTMLQPLSSTSRAMMIGLSSDTLTPIEMGVLAKWNIKPRLMGVPGVANVAIWGERERQLQVQVDPARLSAAGVTLDQIIATAGEALWVSPLSYLESSSPGTAGWIDTPNQRLTIRHLLPISSAEDLAKVTVNGTDGLLLGDVADVVEDHQPLIGDATLKDGPGLLLVIEKFPGANTLEVTREVEAAMAAMAPGLTGMQIDTTVFRPANYIEQAFGNLTTLFLIGTVLAVVALLLFSWSWRAALIGLVAVPLSLVIAGLILNSRGVGFNALTMSGLLMALTILIDDAIIDVDNVRRRLRRRQAEGGEQSTLAVIVDAAAETRGAIVYATLIIALIVMPLFLLQGLSGVFFQPLVVSYLLAVVVSMLVALTVTPALCLLLMGNGSAERRESPVVGALRHGYERMLSATVDAAYPALIVAIVAILLGAAIVPFLEVSLIPAFKQTDLLINWEGPPGTSRLEMNRIMTQVGEEIEAIPGVRNVGFEVGRAITGDQVVGINSGEIWVGLEPGADHDATVAAIDGTIDSYPGLLHAVQTYKPERLGEALLGAGQDVAVRIYGVDLEVLRQKAQEVEAVLAGVDGLVNVRADAIIEEPQVEIEVDLAAAEQYQIKPGEVRRAATTLLSGLRVGNLYEEQKVFDIVVWGVPEIRNNLTDVSELLIDTPTGQVRLADVADVRVVPSPIIIRRDAVSRFIDVNADVRGRSLGAVIDDINRGLDGVDIPFEYHAEVLGISAEQQTANQRILIVALIVAIGILLLLQAGFRSWRLAALVLLTMPAALAGCAVAMFLGGGIVSLGSLFGLMMVLALSVRNGITLINHYRRLEEHEGAVLDRELALRGAGERLGPILTTAITTAVFFLPLAVAGQRAGTEILQPMALVVLGGLVTASLLNLFILPAIYLRFGSSPAPEEPIIAAEEGVLAS